MAAPDAIRIFALPATGFDSLEFFDENQQSAEDKGLLSWLTGSVRPILCSAIVVSRLGLRLSSCKP